MSTNNGNARDEFASLGTPGGFLIAQTTTAQPEPDLVSSRAVYDEDDNCLAPAGYITPDYVWATTGGFQAFSSLSAEVFRITWEYRYVRREYYMERIKLNAGFVHGIGAIIDKVTGIFNRDVGADGARGRLASQPLPPWHLGMIRVDTCNYGSAYIVGNDDNFEPQEQVASAYREWIWTQEYFIWRKAVAGMVQTSGMPYDEILEIVGQDPRTLPPPQGVS